MRACVAAAAAADVLECLRQAAMDVSSTGGAGGDFTAAFTASFHALFSKLSPDALTVCAHHMAFFAADSWRRVHVFPQKFEIAFAMFVVEQNLQSHRELVPAHCLLLCD